MDETAEEGALRELCEETGLPNACVRQLHTFSAPDRDPRERVISVAYYALVRTQEVQGADDAAEARWFPLDQIPPLAFDHPAILDTAFEEVRRQVRLEPKCFRTQPEAFTDQELQLLLNL